jgi:hypothetical protein
MKEWLDVCIKAMQAGITMGTDGLFYSYIGDGYYIESDPTDSDWDVRYPESVMRRKLEVYYIGNSKAMEMDKEYIEEWMGSAV